MRIKTSAPADSVGADFVFDFNCVRITVGVFHTHPCDPSWGFAPNPIHKQIKDRLAPADSVGAFLTDKRKEVFLYE